MKAKLIQLKSFEDARGVLSVGSTPEEIPFEVKRFFVTSATSPEIVRGEHAHKTSHQLLVAVSGSVAAICDDGATKQDFLLDSPTTALYMPPLTWGTQTNFSSGARLLVLSSDVYSPQDYVTSYDEFLALVHRVGEN